MCRNYCGIRKPNAMVVFSCLLSYLCANSIIVLAKVHRRCDIENSLETTLEYAQLGKVA